LETILGIDIGSSKTVALIADIKDKKATITGVGIAPSKGIKKGIITNIDQASSSIKQAVNDARRIADAKVNKAIVSISTAYTKSTKSHGIVNIRDNEISVQDINRAIETAIYNATIPNDYQIIQALPYNFKVDDIADIEDPDGMSGSRLEVSIHITLAQKSGLENTKKMLKLAGIEIENIVLSSFASAIATLNDDEKQQGIALIDIGATTSDLIIFKDNTVRYIDFVGIGSYHITNDLAMAIHTPIKDAELIKLNIDNYNDEDIIEVPSIGDESTSKSANISIIKEVMFARINETLIILNGLIEKSRLKNQITGVVFTGGFSKLSNLKEIAIPIFGNMSVRTAKPKNIDGLFDNLKTPEFSASVGLILYSLGTHSSYEIDSNNKFRSKYSIQNSNIHSSNNIKKEINDIFDTDKKESEEEEEDLIIKPKPDSTSLLEKIKIWFKGIF